MQRAVRRASQAGLLVRGTRGPRGAHRRLSRTAKGRGREDQDGLVRRVAAPRVRRSRATEALAYGGMKIVHGKVICAHAWAREIVLLDSDNEPRVFAGGIIASKTWYRHRDKSADDPAASAD